MMTHVRSNRLFSDFLIVIHNQTTISHLVHDLTTISHLIHNQPNNYLIHDLTTISHLIHDLTTISLCCTRLSTHFSLLYMA